MRREPGLTFQGALAILGHREHRVIDRLDKLLGGVFLAAWAGAAAVGPPGVASLGILAAMWGWLEQRDEALGLLRAAVDAVAGKLDGIGACERRQLIAAAHTMIVVAAFFEALRDRTRSAKFARPQIADRDKEAAAVGRLRRRGESLFDFLCSAELPAPSPSRGFEENCLLLAASMKRISADLQAILEDARHADPTAVSGLIAVDWPTVEKRAVERYRSRYIELAAAVPEFLIWAMLGEHAATRASVAGLRADVVRGRAGQFTASFDSVLADAGIEAVKIPPRCPRANAHAGRLVLAVRTEVTDRVLIVGQRHLRAVLADYETHYNGRRPHRSRQLRPPRPHHPVADLSEERIQRRPVLGGLISEYERAA